MHLIPPPTYPDLDDPAHCYCRRNINPLFRHVNERNIIGGLRPTVATSLAIRKIFQIRRRLPLSGGRQVAGVADQVGLSAARDLTIVLRADELVPLGGAITPIAPLHGPGTRQRMVDRRDLVVQETRIGLVEADALLDDGLVVLV